VGDVRYEKFTILPMCGRQRFETEALCMHVTSLWKGNEVRQEVRRIVSVRLSRQAGLLGHSDWTIFTPEPDLESTYSFS